MECGSGSSTSRVPSRRGPTSVPAPSSSRRSIPRLRAAASACGSTPGPTERTAVRPIDRPTWGGSYLALKDGSIVRAIDGSQLPTVPGLPRRIYFQRSFDLSKSWGKPEIPPELALPRCRILATGRSDYPNQVNNLLAFPGIFRGALDVRASQIKSREALASLPVTRKSDLGALQQETPPLGGLNATPVEELAKLFMSPGPVYDPEGRGSDWWRSARGLFAGGFRAGDRVLNTFAYHFTPAGSMLESGALALGCTVVPATLSVGYAVDDLKATKLKNGAVAITGRLHDTAGTAPPRHARPRKPSRSSRPVEFATTITTRNAPRFIR